MIPLTQEQFDLIEKIKEGVSEEERERIDKRLIEIEEEEDEKYKDYPFAH